MAQREYALGVLVDGMAEGWHSMPSEEEATKQAHTRSIESTETQCIMHGYGPDDEHGEVEYLVAGGEFYKRHDLASLSERGNDMAQREFALGVLMDGTAEGWHSMPSEEDAIKQAHTRSIESTVTQCIMFGSGPDDEHGVVEYLVAGGEFYKRHDL